MSEDKTLAFKVCLKASEPSAHPLATNFTQVGIAQGIAYLDFGFIEPSLLAAIAKTSREAAPKAVEGQIVTRIAMSVDVVIRLHQQIQQVLVGISQARQKSEILKRNAQEGKI